MRRNRNFAGLDSAAISQLAGYLQKTPEEVVATNPRKKQLLFKTTVQHKPLIAKQYLHQAWKHRLASFCGQSKADHYCLIASYLKREGLPVPAPVLLLKAGRRLLPERSLYVMESVNGDMLYHRLHDLENDPDRLAIVAKNVADLIVKLRQAGIIHRDLNTKNFLLSPENELHLIDFDSASRHGIRGKRFVRRHQRDIETFLSTCREGPKLAQAVRLALGSLK